MVGPWDAAESGAHVEGYIDLEDQGTKVRQTEIYKFKQNADEDLWIGTYQLLQKPAEGASITVNFDLEMKLVKDLDMNP